MTPLPLLFPGARSHSRRIWIEIAIVLGLSLGASAVYSIVSLIDAATRPQAIGSQTATINNSLNERPAFDLTYQFLGIFFDFVPVALVFFLVWQAARPHLEVIGLARPRWWRDTASGVALALIVGIPGIALYLAGRALGLSLRVDPNGLDAYWWTIPILLLSSVRAAVTEQVIVIGYLYARLRALGFGPWTIIVSTSVLRGTYHLYQGLPAFVGNVAMGLLFGWLYTRYGRLLPLIVAHFLIDAAVFIGYPYAAVLLPQLFG